LATNLKEESMQTIWDIYEADNPSRRSTGAESTDPIAALNLGSISTSHDQKNTMVREGSMY